MIDFLNTKVIRVGVYKVTVEYIFRLEIGNLARFFGRLKSYSCYLFVFCKFI